MGQQRQRLAAAAGRARVAGRPTAGARHQREQAQQARGTGASSGLAGRPSAAAVGQCEQRGLASGSSPQRRISMYYGFIFLHESGHKTHVT